MVNGMGVCVLAAALSAACANTVQGVKQDSEKIAEKTVAAK